MVKQQEILLLEQNFSNKQTLDSFATTNTLLDSMPEINKPIIHFWTLPKHVILGLKDKRLPNLKKGIDFLHQKGFSTFIRNSGGLAVVNDPKIINISLFLPNASSISVNEAYQKMTQLIQHSLPDFIIKIGEITHSYCPGTFDLSVVNQKIAGMSQRRHKDALVIMLYMSVAGDQISRSELIKQFYQISLNNEENKWNFPDIHPSSMTTLFNIDHSIENNDVIKQNVLTLLETNNYILNNEFLEKYLKQDSYKKLFQNNFTKLQKYQIN